MRYFVHDADGNIVSAGECQPQNLDAFGGNGLTARAGDSDPWTQYFDGENLVTYPAEIAVLRREQKPAGFRWSRGHWLDERSLEQAKAQKWEEIKRARRKAESAGFFAEGRVWDSNDRSQQQIAMAVQDMDHSGQDWVKWKSADNQVVTLDTMQMRGLLQALRSHIQDRRNRAEDLRWRIESATSVAEVTALSWEG